MAVLMVAVAGMLAACGGGEAPAPEQPAEPPAAAAPAATGQPRVFFVEPQDGAMVTSPVKLVFGAENIEVGKVPQTVEKPREGIVHHHLSVDNDCLPPGTIIEKVEGGAWIHFGDGSNQIEMQLPAGGHRLTLQAGDDEHRTIEGLCQTIKLMVK